MYFNRIYIEFDFIQLFKILAKTEVKLSSSMYNQVKINELRTIEMIAADIFINGNLESVSIKKNNEVRKKNITAIDVMSFARSIRYPRVCSRFIHGLRRGRFNSLRSKSEIFPAKHFYLSKPEYIRHECAALASKLPNCLKKYQPQEKCNIIIIR